MYVKNEPYTDKNEERFFNYGLNLGRNDKINLTVSLYKESTFTSISMNRAKLNEGWNYGAITLEKTGKDTYKVAHYVNGTEIESTDRQYRYVYKKNA